jgi:hypothetical protein
MEHNIQGGTSGHHPFWLWEYNEIIQDAQFTWELILHVSEAVHLNAPPEKKIIPQNDNHHPQTDISAQLATLQILEEFRSLQQLHMTQLHGFEERLNDQGIIRNHTKKIETIKFLSFFCVVFDFLEAKRTAI